MENFTVLKTTKPKKKINNLFLVFNIILLIIIGLIGYSLQNTLINQIQKASGIQCKTITNIKDCNVACSPEKQDGKKYSCKWLYKGQKCVESSKECGAYNVPTTGSCPAGSTPTDTFDHCNNCKAICDCKDNNNNTIGTYLCPSKNNLCEIYYPEQCEKNLSSITTPTSTPILSTPTSTLTPTTVVFPTITNTPTPTPTSITPSNEPTSTLILSTTPTSVPSAPTATPTEIILAQTTSTATPQAPVSGDVKRPLLIFGIPLAIIVAGLLL